MSARKRRNIFQTRDDRFNYRFGNPASRKRYRVRSKRRLIIAICVLLVFLLAAGALVYQFFLKDKKEAPASPAADTTTEQQTAEDGTVTEVTREVPMAADGQGESEMEISMTFYNAKPIEEPVLGD